MTQMQYGHYIILDNQNQIINGFSTGNMGPDTDLSKAIFIHKGGLVFYLTTPEEKEDLYVTDYFIPQYKYINGQIIKKTPEEIEKEIPIIKKVPTEEEKMRADIDYIAALGGIQL